MGSRGKSIRIVNCLEMFRKRKRCPVSSDRVMFCFMEI